MHCCCSGCWSRGTCSRRPAREASTPRARLRLVAAGQAGWGEGVAWQLPPTSRQSASLLLSLFLEAVALTLPCAARGCVGSVRPSGAIGWAQRRAHKNFCYARYSAPRCKGPHTGHFLHPHFLKLAQNGRSPWCEERCPQRPHLRPTSSQHDGRRAGAHAVPNELPINVISVWIHKARAHVCFAKVPATLVRPGKMATCRLKRRYEFLI